MNKLLIAIFIIGFWLLLPLPMQLLDVSNYEQLKTDLDINEDATPANALKLGYKIITTYFQMVFIWIPNVPNAINYFLWLLRLVSGLVLALILKGD